MSALVELLKEQIRESGILSRFDGNELVVIMKQMKSGESTVKKGEDICRSICEYPFADNIRTCCSVGVVTWDTRKPPPAILRYADQALYRARAENKGGCCMWEGEYGYP